jgi:alpha-L-rhamnosidase
MQSSCSPAPLTETRIPVSPHPCPGNAGIRSRYPLDTAAWIWHPDPSADTGFQILTFRLELELEEDQRFCFDVSADQRYILRCDGREVGRGPDRAEAGGWSFHRYSLSLSAGPHVLEADAWWLPPEDAPQAQVSVSPGFALAGADETSRVLDTGSAAWRVCAHTGISPLPKAHKLSYHVIGCGFRLEADRSMGMWCDPVTVYQGRDDEHGIVQSPRRCEPSPLPEQERVFFQGGQLRGREASSPFQGLCRGEAVTIPPHSDLELFWDFEAYVCGYPRAQLRGGEGAVLSLEWAESLYYTPEPTAASPKGQRDAFEGKHWLGFGDEIHACGGERTDEILWWRSGRWLRIRVRTADEPLEILDLRPLRTGYPFQRKWAFASPGLSADMLDICENGLRNCVHETFVDCPYYEQLQYLGDTRIQALCWLAATGDPRPVVRALELFDRSRWVNGFFAERCPSADPQMSATYSLIYPLMLRDFNQWVPDSQRVKQHLPGVRSSLEMALSCLDDSGLPVNLPGWLFVDWVWDPFWRQKLSEGEPVPLTASIALHLPLALMAAAELEESAGEVLLAERWRAWAEKIYRRIEQEFWCEKRRLMADDAEKAHWSEHAQALTLLLPFPEASKRGAMLQSLLTPSADMARASVYFSFYVHEVLARAGRGDALLDRFGFWDRLHAQGFLTTVEAPEPARSDCHGWGSHPLYHSLTGLAGIRPAATGFARVSIRPSPGTLESFEAAVPHPQGEIRMRFRRTGEQILFEVETPVPGTLVWRGEEYPLKPGVPNRVDAVY